MIGCQIHRELANAVVRASPSENGVEGAGALGVVVLDQVAEEADPVAAVHD